jgi:hypothetical protein
MRRGLFQSEFVIDNNLFTGIALGYDYCAEHESGIDDLKKSLGIRFGDFNFLGIEGRLITKIPDSLKIVKLKYKNKIWHNLFFHPYMTTPYHNSPICENLLEDFGTAWNSKSFGITLKGSKNPKIKYIQELYEAIINKNAIFCFINKNEKNPFGRSYPFLAIADRLENDFIENMYNYDLNLKKLKEDSDKTGIEDYLKKLGKGYFSLYPSWAIDFEKSIDGRILKTEYSVVYFLNSNNIQKYKSGWFTVEELKMWAHDVGPVMVELENFSKDYIFKEE